MLYLASQSPRRKTLLETLRIPFKVLAPPVGLDMEQLEAARPKENPVRYVRRVTLAKLKVAQSQLGENDFALVADTTVTIDGLILGKPLTTKNNIEVLRRLSGKTHRVLTAVALASVSQSTQILTVARVRFAPLSEPQIQRYVNTGEGLDKAGGYAIQGGAAPFVVRIIGDYSGIVGLPLHATATLLAQLNIHPLDL